MIIHKLDNVEIHDDGHKYALKDIAVGENIIKYGMPIGKATQTIKKGEHVHTHNVTTNLSGKLDYTYTPDFVLPEIKCDKNFLGFRRADGQVGIRNDIWIIPTVGCINGLASEDKFGCDCEPKDDVIFIDHGKIILSKSADELRTEYNESIDEIFRRMFKC